MFSENGINFYIGVPDSLLKDFCSYIADNVSSENHIISSNEGSAVALAAGHYLATGNPALVYMQNSGLGNSINPLLSLADREVYGIPMILMIGWRGEPGKKDEPQHLKQGRVMLKMLDAMEINHKVIDKNTENLRQIINEICGFARENNSPSVLVVSEGSFEKYNHKEDLNSGLPLTREEAIKNIVENTGENTIVVSTTGKTSRELYEIRDMNKKEHGHDFLTVGSMGHASQIALGIALQKKNRQVFVLDGDGALLMQMGSMAITGTIAPDNFKHILINNGAHESVGGQPTAGFKIDFIKIAEACGYGIALSCKTEDDLKEKVKLINTFFGPAFLEIKVNKSSRSNLGRPKETPTENKKIFMDYLRK